MDERAEERPAGEVSREAVERIHARHYPNGIITARLEPREDWPATVPYVRADLYEALLADRDRLARELAEARAREEGRAEVERLRALLEGTAQWLYMAGPHGMACASTNAHPPWLPRGATLAYPTVLVLGGAVGLHEALRPPAEAVETGGEGGAHG